MSYTKEQVLAMSYEELTALTFEERLAIKRLMLTPEGYK